MQGKNWFPFSFPDELRAYITNKDVLSKYADLRTLEKELEAIDRKLQNNSSFYEATSLVDELEKAKTALNDSQELIPKLELEIQQIINTIEKEKRALLQTLN